MTPKQFARALAAVLLVALASPPSFAEEPAASPKLRVYVVRHGAAWKNVPAADRPKGMSQKDLDSLTPEGLARAKALGTELAGRDIVAVYTSPARRAEQTAAPIASALGFGAPIVNEAFRPLDAGSDARASSGTVRAKNWSSGRDPRPPGGESLEDGYTRASAALTAIAKEHAGHAVVVVTHGEIASTLLTKAAGQPLLTGYFDHFPNQGTIHEITVP